MLVSQATDVSTGDVCAAACVMLNASDGAKALAILTELGKFPDAAVHGNSDLQNVLLLVL